MKTMFLSLFFLLMLLKVDSAYVQSTLNTCVKAPDNMVAWWPLEDPDDTPVKDIIGGNDGVLFGVLPPDPANRF